MNDDLYHQEIVACAKSPAHAGTLENPDGRATAHNALCGDRVTVNLTLAAGRVTALRYQVRGCLLCKAACARLAQLAAGAEVRILKHLHRELAVMLKAQGTPAGALPADLALFGPVRSHKSRHSCVLLPFEAACEALVAAQAGENTA